MTFDLLSRVVATKSGSDAETAATKKKTGRRKWKIEERTSETASMSMAIATRRAERKSSIEERVSLRADDSRVSSSPKTADKTEAEAKPRRRRQEQETVKINISELLASSTIAEEVAKPVATVTINPSKAASRPATFELAPVDRLRSKPPMSEPSRPPATTDWLEVADPGLADLVSTPTSGVLALEELLASA